MDISMDIYALFSNWIPVMYLVILWKWSLSILYII